MQYYGGMPRLAIPQELGGAYVYLLSDNASYTTGIDIPIAGQSWYVYSHSDTTNTHRYRWSVVRHSVLESLASMQR